VEEVFPEHGTATDVEVPRWIEKISGQNPAVSASIL